MIVPRDRDPSVEARRRSCDCRRRLRAALDQGAADPRFEVPLAPPHELHRRTSSPCASASSQDGVMEFSSREAEGLRKPEATGELRPPSGEGGGAPASRRPHSRTIEHRTGRDARDLLRDAAHHQALHPRDARASRRRRGRRRLAPRGPRSPAPRSGAPDEVLPRPRCPRNACCRSSSRCCFPYSSRPFAEGLGAEDGVDARPRVRQRVDDVREEHRRALATGDARRLVECRIGALGEIGADDDLMSLGGRCVGHAPTVCTPRAKGKSRAQG